jgi:hypothetical protein
MSCYFVKIQTIQDLHCDTSIKFMLEFPFEKTAFNKHDFDFEVPMYVTLVFCSSGMVDVFCIYFC